MAYTKIIATEDGESRFEDVAMPAETSEMQVLLPPQPCVSWEIGQGPSSPTTQFRTTRVPKILLVLEGELEIGVSNGELRRFRPGDIMHATDTTGKGHTARRIGSPLCRVLSITAQ